MRLKLITILACLSWLSILTLADVPYKGDHVPKSILDAIERVESGCLASAIGDGGKAVGSFQIHPVMVKEVNRIIGKEKYTLKDRQSRQKSREMCEIYLDYWGNQYKKETGKTATDEVLSSLWCSGPTGYKKTANKNIAVYIKKVKKELKKG